MSGRRYRVVERLPWIEGGRPAPVIYEPGDTVYVDDQEVASIYRKLEAIDDEGRAILEAARAKAPAPAKATRTAVTDLTPNDVERLTQALDEARRRHGCVPEYAVNRDGSETLLRYIPTNRLPGVVYGDNGLPDPWATALKRERSEKEKKLGEMESKLARIRSGGSLGGRRGRETKRDETARSNEALLADVRAYRAEHPLHGGPAIAAALLEKHGRIRDFADSRGREKAIEALRKRIARLEKSLDE